MIRVSGEFLTNLEMEDVSVSLSFSIFIIFGEMLTKNINRGAVKVQIGLILFLSCIVPKLDMKTSINFWLFSKSVLMNISSKRN